MIFPLPTSPPPPMLRATQGVGGRAASATSSSPTLAATKMADKKISKMSDFFKKTTVTE
jgi:hypothetical protein